MIHNVDLSLVQDMTFISEINVILINVGIILENLIKHDMIMDLLKQINY